MLSDESLLSFVIEQCKELGISGYDIGQNTEVPEQTAYKILNGTSKSPRRKNLLIILKYIESKTVGTKLDALKPPISYSLNDEILRVEESVEAVFKKIPIAELFTDVGTELLISYKKQITVFELNVELFKKNANLLEEKIQYLTAKA